MMKKVCFPLIFCSVIGGCYDDEICYAYSSSEIELAVERGVCRSIFVSEIADELLRFTNDEPSVTVFIDQKNNSNVRRVEADGRGVVSTNGVDEVILTHSACNANTGLVQLIEVTIGAQGDGLPVGCDFYAEPASTVRMAAHDGVTVDFIDASSSDWSDVVLEVDESAWPVGTLVAEGPPLDVLQAFGSNMNDVLLNAVEEDVLTGYFAWLDGEGYDGTVHVNSGDAEQTPVQVYPPISE